MGKGRRNKRRDNPRYEPPPSYDSFVPEPEGKEDVEEEKTFVPPDYSAGDRALAFLFYGLMSIDEAIVLHGTFRHMLAVWTNTTGPRAVWYKFACSASLIFLSERLIRKLAMSRSKLRGSKLLWAQDEFHLALVVLYFRFQKSRPITLSLYPLALLAAEEICGNLGTAILPIFFRSRVVVRQVGPGIIVAHKSHPAVQFFLDFGRLLTSLANLAPYLHLLVLGRAMLDVYHRQYSVYGALVYLYFVLHLYYTGAYGKSRTA